MKRVIKHAVGFSVIALIALCVSVVVVYAFTPKSASSTAAPKFLSANTRTTISFPDVQSHSGSSSCWSVINGKVYDLTSYISQHRGGEQTILAICGTDGSSAFNNQHGGQRRPEQDLTSLYVADLKQ